MTLDPTFRSTFLRILIALLVLAMPVFLLFEGYRWYLFSQYENRLVTLLPALMLSLAFWMTGLVLVLRYFHRTEARLLFLITQILGWTLSICTLADSRVS